MPSTYSKNLKERVLAIYGRFCACCGEDSPAFLTLDHIDGKGAAHRRSLGLGRRGGERFYAKIIKLHKDPNLQILCMNCNLARHVQGVCPHEASLTP